MNLLCSFTFKHSRAVIATFIVVHEVNDWSILLEAVVWRWLIPGLQKF